MSKLHLIDLDTSSEDEEMGDVMISRRVMQNRLGWLSMVKKPQREEVTRTWIEIDVVPRKHDENPVQDRQDDQQNQMLTDFTEVTTTLENENVEKDREDKDVLRIPTHIKTTEIEKGEKENISGGRAEAIDKQEIQELTKVETTTGRPESNGNDTPTEENEEAMLPKDVLLLTFVEKTSPKQIKTATAEI